MLRRLIAIAALLASTTAYAATVSIEVPGDEEQSGDTVVYDCSGIEVGAQYINSGPVSLAVLTIGEDFVVASNVLSGSGAKYAGAQYIWWSEGDGAQLIDLMQGGEDSPTACTPA